MAYEDEFEDYEDGNYDDLDDDTYASNQRTYNYDEDDYEYEDDYGDDDTYEMD